MKKLNRLRLSMVALTAWVSTSAGAQTLLGVNYVAATVESTGVTINANYGGAACLTKPVSAQLYLVNGSQVTYQGSCYVNAAWEEKADGTLSPHANKGFCPLREPRTSNPQNSTLVRLWKVTSDCTKYAYEVGQTGTNAYQDVWVNGANQQNRFYGQNNNSLVTIDKPYYKMRIDSRGGATYEFYNKRATLNGSAFVANAVHPDVGAGLQIAIQDHGQTFASSCDIYQGFFNPTQAGSFCTSTSTFGNSPTSSALKSGSWPTQLDASGKLVFPEHVMRNWDYTTGTDTNWQGPIVSFPLSAPYKTLDSTTLQQTTTPRDTYVEYDILVKNLKSDSPPRPSAFVELPTWYFTNSFRMWTVKHANSNVASTWTIPDRLKNTRLTPAEMGLTYPDFSSSDYFNHDYVVDGLGTVTSDVFWITFENVKGSVNDVYTIAWFYDPGFRADVAHPKYAYTLEETDMFRMLKFANVPTFNMQPNKDYKFKYVVFPFRWNETLPGSTRTVEQEICEIKKAYEGASQAACRL